MQGYTLAVFAVSYAEDFTVLLCVSSHEYAEKCLKYSGLRTTVIHKTQCLL